MAEIKKYSVSIEEEIDLLSRGTAEIINTEDLKEKIKKSRENNIPLKVKLGIDPTAPHIHLGFAVVLRKMRLFQDLGHRIQLLIGDFTARVGDPTGRSETRKVLTPEQIEENACTYKQQLSLILDPHKTDVHFNSHWLEPLNFADILQLTSKYTVARILERDDFFKRYSTGKPIGMHEFLYPLMQGYDSVALKSDVEMGGTDQKFNILVGRDLQKEYGQEPQVVFLMPILEGTDGVLKMSKSYGNYIGITEPPGEMFGKVMSIPDNLIIKYFWLCTDVPPAEVNRLESELKEGVNPRDIKLRLGYEIVKIYHGEESGRNAREEFLKIFSRKELPTEIPLFPIPPSHLLNNRIKLINLLTLAGLSDSKRNAKRLIEQGAVKLDGVKLWDPQTEIEIGESKTTEKILQVGNRNFLKIT